MPTAKTIYKKTDIPWISEIPAHWEVRRLKYLTKEPLQYGINVETKFYKHEGIRFLRTTDLNEEGEIIGSGIYLDKEMVSDNYLLKKGDILFSRSGTVGRAYFHQTDEPMTYAGFLVRFRLEDIELAKWVYYYSKTPQFKHVLYSGSIKSTIQNFNGQKYNNIAISIPSDKQEQTAIAGYLDRQVEKINHFIKKKRHYIALLKEQRQAIINQAVTQGINPNAALKNSGIEGLGKIPAHWQVRRLKNIVNYEKGKVPKNFSEDSTKLPYLTMDYLRGKDENVIYVADGEKNVYVEKDDILVLWDGANAGEIIKAKKGYLSSTMAVLKTNEKYFHKDFFYYFLKAKEGYFKDMANGTTIPHLDPDSVFNKSFAIPPKQEQTAIVSHIKNKTAKIDLAIGKVQKEIELIQEYKEAMIAEAVLGKLMIDK